MSLPPPPGPHPSADELRRARRGPRSAREERVLEHAALCARCAEEEYRMDAFERPAPVSAREAESAWRRLSGDSPAHVSMWRPLALAASLLIAVGTVFAVRHRTERDVVRGGSTPAALERPYGLLAGPPSSFRFAPVDAAPLRVFVCDAARTYEWTSPPVTDGQVPFPPEEQRKLRPGIDYTWTVLGADAPARTFRIRP